MPRAYSVQEREKLKDELRRVGLQYLLANGVRKTTVDDLVRIVRIPKGTFYLLFPSKEVLASRGLTLGMRLDDWPPAGLERSS